MVDTLHDGNTTTDTDRGRVGFNDGGFLFGDFTADQTQQSATGHFQWAFGCFWVVDKSVQGHAGVGTDRKSGAVDQEHLCFPDVVGLNGVVLNDFVTGFNQFAFFFEG